MSNVRYRQIVRNYEQRFRHKVRLLNCRTWRMGYVDAQVAYLRADWERASWSTQDGNDCRVYGFHCPVHAAVLTDWSQRCGIDWSIAPELQTDRPPGPSEAPWTKPEPAHDHDPNLHGVTGTGWPLGVTCKACGHRALVPLDRLGAHSGNMQKISTLKLKCAACGSREWEPTVFRRAEDLAGCFGDEASTPPENDSRAHVEAPAPAWVSDLDGECVWSACPRRG